MTLLKTSLIGTAVAFGISLSGAAWADAHSFEITGDAAAGEKVFRKCKACHEIGEGAQSKTGPALNGILGRAAGSYGDFKYSPALSEKVAEGLIWTPETLDAFLVKPKKYISGTKMSFVGLRKDDDRTNLIAYLASFAE